MSGGKYVVTCDTSEKFEKTYVYDKSFWERNKEDIVLFISILSFLVGAILCILAVPLLLSSSSSGFWAAGIAIASLLIGIIFLEIAAIKVPENCVIVAKDTSTSGKGKVRVFMQGKIRNILLLVARSFVILPLESIKYKVSNTGEEALICNDLEEVAVTALYCFWVLPDGCSMIAAAKKVDSSSVEEFKENLGRDLAVLVKAKMREAFAKVALEELLKSKSQQRKIAEVVQDGINEKLKDLGLTIENFRIDELYQTTTEGNAEHLAELRAERDRKKKRS